MQCAYVNAVTIAVNFALNKNHNLFTDAEVDLLSTFSTLPYNGQRIYARLLTRQSKWMKTSDFEKYVDKNLGTNVDPAVATAIEALIARNYLNGINKHVEFETAWDAAVSSFVIPDWQAISSTLLGAKSKATNREELIQAIRRAIDTQKTFFGASQRDRFADIVCRHMLDTHNCSLVRLCDEMALLIRRVQRLYQVPSSVATSSGGLDSAYRKLEICVPLMTTFKLLTFPRYLLPADFSALNNSFLFLDQRTFRCWEAAVELHAMIYELDELEHQLKKGEVHISIFDTLSPRMMQTMASCIAVFKNDKFMALFASDKSSFEGFIKNIISDFEVESTRFTTKKVGLVGTICLLSLCAECDYEVPVEEADYLIRYRAGTELCRILLATTSTLEKTTEKLYLLSILLYEFLLCLPYIKHGRGKWYIRLCIDYEHMKLPEMALAATERGLLDKNILGSDEIGLTDRASVLRERVSKQQLAKIKESTKKQRKSTFSSASITSVSAVTNEQQTCDEYIRNIVTILQSEVWRSMTKIRQMQLLSAMILQEMERVYRPVVTSQSHRRVFQPSSSLPSSSSAAPAAPAEVSVVTTGKWTCQACTYVNNDSKQKLSCEMCMSPRSSNSKVASSLNSTMPAASTSSSSKRSHGQITMKREIPTENRHVINLIDDDDDNNAADSSTDVLEIKPTVVDLIETPSTSHPAVSVHRRQEQQVFMSWKYRDMLIEFQREVTGDKNTSQEQDDDFLHASNNEKDEVIDLSKDQERLLAETVLKKCADILSSLPPPPPPPMSSTPPLSQQTITSRNSSPSRRQLRQQFSPSSSSVADFASGIFTGRAFVVNGRRFHGDVNNKRKGKSIFCGVDDDMMSVEDLVMKKLLTVDTDEQQLEEDHLHSSSAASSSSKAVLMLRNFRFLSYARIADNGGWQGYHCEGSIFRTLFGLLIWDVFFLPVPHALLTMHQDAPLDFPTVAFFTARQTQIIERIQQIAHSSNSQLIMELQRIYHLHKGEQCRLVSWDSWDLKALQLAALCIGAKGLAHLCLAMCIDYRQFRSGAPDLFMMRVKIVHDRDGHEQVVPLEQLLGENWQSRGVSAEDDEALFGEDLRKPLPSKSDSQQQGGSGWGQPRFSLRRQFSGGSTTQSTGKSDGRKQSPQRSTSSPQKSSFGSPTQKQRSEQHSPLAAAAVVEDQSMQPLQLPSLSPGSKLVYECMWIEVKGPSDHLAYKQLLWLQLLSAANLPAYVGHVKERYLGGMSRKKAKTTKMTEEEIQENGAMEL